MLPHHKALNPIEVQTITGKPITTYKYIDLEHMNDIQDLFQQNDRVLILYENKHNMGHWICLINQPTSIVFFDPYSLEPDSQLAFINIKFRNEQGIRLPYLTSLMLQSWKPIDYNDVQMQRFKENIVSCGYHCGLRMRFEELTNREYSDIFQDIPIIDRDAIVVKCGLQLLSG